MPTKLEAWRCSCGGDLLADAFPPSDPARNELVECLHQSPLLLGFARSRWSLALIAGLPQVLGVSSLSGLCRRLQKWRISRKRSRDYLHSPDPLYQEKVAAVQERLASAKAHPDQEVMLYADEFTLYRQPAAGTAYHPRGRGGKAQPRARRSYRANTKWRVVGALNAHTGRVSFRAGAHAGRKELRSFLRQLRAEYGPGLRITLVWDNWPVHFHPEVLKAAQEADIELLFLPTYAPWTNPIEKLWGQLKDELLRLHPWADLWDPLKAAVQTFLASFSRGSPALLHRVGLLPEGASA